MMLLEAHDLYRFYHVGDDETLALRGVSLSIAAGEMVAVMGPSGSGKSTLLACLAGLDEPDGGYVTVMGSRLSRRPEATRARLRAAHIGVLMQSGNLFEHLSVADNIRVPMRLAAKFDERRVSELLEMVGLSHRRHATPAQLSGGEAQRAGLATALAANPALLLADEPTGEVDAATEAQILDLLAARRKLGAGLLIATHSAGLAASADRIIRLNDGRIASE
ncbi:MAG: ABC transporter ATP-binding protein [Candidatus Chloroheliales bacterium]|nr:MAG: ABC transporter ATP-binding protein [Chloroflexota bacterium]